MVDIKELVGKLNKKNLEHNTKYRSAIWITYVIMTFVLAVLKLTGYIGITWLWVFSPIWLPPTFILSLTFGLLTLALLAAAGVGVVGAFVIGSKMLWEKLMK